jgi:hypothetical protein
MAVTELVYEIEDASGDKATTSVKVISTTTVALMTGFATGFATALNNMIAGKILSVAAFLGVDISALTGNLVGANSDVEHIGKFEFLSLGGFRVKVNVPALAEVALGATTSDSLNQSQVDIAAFIAAMEDGVAVTGGLIEPCDVGEDDISDVVFAREAFRNSGARR